MIIYIIIILTQTLLNIFLISSIVIFEDNITIIGVPVHLLFMMMLNILCLVLLAVTAIREQKRKISLTENTHEEQFQALVTSVRSDRHDLNNHLTVVAGLIKLNKFPSAASYIDNIVGEVQITNRALQISNPILSSMLYTKMGNYAKEQIPFELAIESETFAAKLSSTDFIRLLSNLLDNAHDATVELPKEKHKIVLAMTENDRGYQLTIKNTSIHTTFNEKFLEMGYSTKSQGNRKRGYGLAIINQITQKYHGELKITNENSLVVIEIHLPRS
ncbi:sensor histidine kinase [Evansella sp. AB-rgal1]|uniref:sensor histidine kinase n=1 Tax=Evansella sp. AB-rgal1 TaxID=3242696 RepID=UPI00359F0EAD